MFITKKGGNQNVLLKGGNAPKRDPRHAAELIQRPAAKITPNNAPSQMRDSVLLSNHAVNPGVQVAYLNALIRNKTKNGTTIGAQSWIGKQFSQ